MRYKIIIFSVVLFALSVVLAINFHKNKLQPRPTQVLNENEKGEGSRQLQFEKWINEMHRAADGVNWRKTDAETRFKKYSERLTKQGKSVASETLADGHLTGIWKERGSINQSGRIHLAELDTATNTLYCGSSGGNIWKGNIDGTGWQPLNDKLKFDNIILLQLIPNGTSKRLLVCAGGSRFYYTDNDGATWHFSVGLGSVQNSGNINRAVVLNNTQSTIYLLAYEWDYTNWYGINTIYKSINKGLSFSKIKTYDEPTYGDANHFDIWAPRYGASNVYLLHDNEISYLDQNTNQPVSISTFNVDTLGNTLLTGCKTANATYLYAYIHKKIFRSADGGQSWNLITYLGKDNFFKTSFSCSITNPDFLFFGDYECHYSSNGGQTWNKVNDWAEYYASPSDKLHADIPSVVSLKKAGGSEVLFINTDGGTYISNDMLQTVQNLSLGGLNVSQYYSVYTNRNNTNYVYAGSQDQGFQRCHADNGNFLSFDQVISGDYGHIVSSNNGNSIWMVYPGFAIYYPYAANQDVCYTWDYDAGLFLWMAPLMDDPTASNKVFIAGGNISGSGTHIIRLTCSGFSISATELPFDFQTASGSARISAMAYSPLNNSYRYVLTDNGKFFYSTDGGTNWTISNSFNGPESHYFYGACILPSKTQLGSVYISGSGYSNPGCYKSTDNGQTFFDLSSGLPPTMVYQLASDNNEKFIFAATEVGPYVYIKETNYWYDMEGIGAPDQNYWTVEYVPSLHTARFGTYGRGIWDFIVDTTATKINESFAMNHKTISVFPNPANAKINVEINMENNHPIEINIYDLSGKLIKNITNGDANGVIINISDIPSGIYLINIMGKTKIFTEKIIIQH
ncbi:MAG: T9SS type A sorting domain-containing protein [Bacteroidia bacterium]|nr:T9SS type A sorting domain-containing protein [Bacteroidia bacterium]